MASSATSACTEDAEPKVGTDRAAVTAWAPVGKGIAIWLDISAGAPETSMELPITATAASAMVECMLEELVGRKDWLKEVVLKDQLQNCLVWLWKRRRN